MTALVGYRVLELAEGVAGEYCGKLLSDFAAEVIKIERPGTGSPTRRLGPFAGTGESIEHSGLFAYLNTGKRSVVVDLESGAGRDMMRQLLDSVDVVIDDHAPGWLASVSLDPARIDAEWPGLVVCSITPYGQNPPEERQHAEDLTVFHSSGWGFHTPGVGFEDMPPLKGPGRFFSHYEAGQEAAMYVAGCLYDRDRDGRGRFIDVSMHEVMVSRADYVVAQFVAGEMDVTDWRGGFDMHGPGGIFPCKDGFIYVFMATPDQWAAYRKMVGDPEWARELPQDWLMKGLTPERIALTRRDLCAWLEDRNKVDAAHEAQELGITLVPVNTPGEVMASPQYRHRHYFADVTHPVLGTAKYPTVPYKLSETPAAISAPAPLLGQHNAQYRGER
ncbi:MAG: CaiB/BaiF CoA transferase family protein [Novosphingobium sp.]